MTSGSTLSPALWGLRWALGALRPKRDKMLPCCRVFGPETLASELPRQGNEGSVRLER